MKSIASDWSVGQRHRCDAATPRPSPVWQSVVMDEPATLSMLIFHYSSTACSTPRDWCSSLGAMLPLAHDNYVLVVVGERWLLQPRNDKKGCVMGYE